MNKKKKETKFFSKNSLACVEKSWYSVFKAIYTKKKKRKGKMPDKHASKRREFYLNKIKENEKQCNNEAFDMRSSFELKELLNSLKNSHDNVSMLCDDNSSENQKEALSAENSEIDALVLKLKAKINMRLDLLVNKKYALPAPNEVANVEKINAFNAVE